MLLLSRLIFQFCSQHLYFPYEKGKLPYLHKLAFVPRSFHFALCTGGWFQAGQESASLLRTHFPSATTGRVVGRYKSSAWLRDALTAGHGEAAVFICEPHTATRTEKGGMLPLRWGGFSLLCSKSGSTSLPEPASPVRGSQNEAASLRTLGPGRGLGAWVHLLRMPCRGGLSASLIVFPSGFSRRARLMGDPPVFFGVCE